MLSSTHYTISNELLQEAIIQLPSIVDRLAINQPTGHFFNDPWEIKPDFKDTVWDTLLKSLDEPKGEARLIKLAQGESYPSHADIDDRWHLSLVGNHSYLINLETDIMYPIKQDGVWYSMDAGIRHTAANFGSIPRIQLVVRKLLPVAHIVDPKNISIKYTLGYGERRFIFDDIVSPWLNRAYKKGIIDNFVGIYEEATLTIEAAYIPELTELIKLHFTVEVV